ncbi:MAG: CHAT domain-containing tetratricopeptide repeat protein [Cytophagales bacterium]|nr:CHAT domain-containing tetratricopeptide repeat protein [Cytophagales bacterium]
MSATIFPERKRKIILTHFFRKSALIAGKSRQITYLKESDNTLTVLKYTVICVIYFLSLKLQSQPAEGCDLPKVKALIFDGKYQEAEHCALALLDQEINDDLRAKVLTALGEAMMNQSRDGQQFLEEALQLEISQGLDSLIMAETLLILSKNAANLGRFDDGLAYNDQSIAIREKLVGPDHWTLADNHNMLGYCHRFTSKYDRALENYEEAARIWELFDGELKTSMGPTYDGLGILSYVLSRPTTSLEYLNHSLELKKELLKTEMHPSISNTLQYIARNYYDLHQYHEALKIYSRVLEIRQQTLGESHVNVGVAYGLLADCHSELGNYDLAIEFYRRQIPIYQQFLPSDYLLSPYTNLAEAYKNNGQSKFFLENLAKSEAVINVSSRFGGQYLVNNYLLRASYYQSIGDESQRLKILQQCSNLVDAELSEIAGQRSKVDFSLGQYHLDHEAFETAGQFFDRALKRKAGFYGPESPVLHENYLALGDLNFQRNRFSLARDYYQKSLDLQRIDKSVAAPIPEVNNLLVPLEGLVSISKIASSLYALYLQDTTQRVIAQQSTTYYEAALKYLHFLRNSFQSDEAKIRISQLFEEVSAEALDLTYELYRKTQDLEWLEKAFWISEMRRSQVLVQAINEGNLKSLAKVPDTLLRKELNLYGELAYLRQKLINTNPSDPTQQDLEERLFQKARELDSLKLNIRKYFPEYHHLKYEITLTLPDIQQELEESEVMLAYSMTGHYIYRFTLSKDQSTFDQVIKPVHWQSLLQDHQRSTANYHFIVNQAQVADQMYRNSSRDLYRLLIPDLSETTRTNQVLTIVPHGALYSINFAILLTQDVQKQLDFRNYPYLIKDHDIRYSSSASSLIANNQWQRKGINGYIGFAAPQTELASASNGPHMAIPGVHEEITAVGSLFNGKMLLGSMATETNFRYEAANYDLIHLAMHGTVDQESPLNSKLYFSGKEDSLNDGTLYLDEVYSIPLNADLAVLSACETGDGKLHKSEGLMSMAHAFNYAGCRSVLLSQWKIADQESTHLIIDFFRQLKRGQSKSASLRTAQLNYLERIDGNMRTHPFFWAGFRMMGGNEAIVGRHESLKEWLAILAIVGLVFIVLFRKKKKTS